VPDKGVEEGSAVFDGGGQVAADRAELGVSRFRRGRITPRIFAIGPDLQPSAVAVTSNQYLRLPGCRHGDAQRGTVTARQESISWELTALS
jgi:hypothetical protein